MKKAFLAQLDRFGYTLTSIGRSRTEAEKAVIDAYKQAYKDANNSDPAKDILYDNRTYLQVAKEEIYTEEFEFGEVRWF